jgi:hypothetical protein
MQLPLLPAALSRRGGGLYTTRPGKVAPRPLVMMAATGELSANMAVLTATQGSQISTSSPDKGHGVFTYYFLKTIKEGKKDLAEIFETIKPQVEDKAKRLNVRLTPGLNPGADKIKGKFSLRN